MTPQKVPLRQQLFNSVNKQSSDKKSASTLTKRPFRVALQDQLRGGKQSETEISTMRSLAKSFKSRAGLRNEPLLVGNGLPKTEPIEDHFEVNIHQSYTRLNALKQSENLLQE